MKEKNFVTGKFVDGSAVVYTRNDFLLVNGLLFADGNTKWFDVFYFGDFSCGLARSKGFIWK